MLENLSSFGTTIKTPSHTIIKLTEKNQTRQLHTGDEIRLLGVYNDTMKITPQSVDKATFLFVGKKTKLKQNNNITTTTIL
jgi:hypothetical protein